MTYVAQQDLVDRFGEKELIELTDRATPALGAIDAAVINKAIADAGATINGYLSVKYALPISPVPTNLVRIAGDVARYYLHEDRATEQVKARFDAAIAFLKDVAAGRASLGVDASSVAPAEAGGPAYQANERAFTEDSLSDY